jgi:anti-sigma factor ChrR (cupin superfamily)
MLSAAGGDSVPKGQSTHAGVSTQYVLLGQLTHADGELEPGEGEYRPTSQAVQVVEPMPVCTYFLKIILKNLNLSHTL